MWSDNFEAATRLDHQPGRHGHRNHRTVGTRQPLSEDTNLGGAKQLGTTVSGSNDLVTGRLAVCGRG